MEILIEKFDSGLFENKVIEEEGIAKTYKIVGPFIECNTKNKNERVYPSKIIQPQVEEYQKVIKENRAVGELNHPNTLEIDPKNIAIKIEKLNWCDDNLVMGEARICSTPNGTIIKNLIDDGIKLGVSSRGAGTVKKGIVQSDYRYVANDVVWDPSAPSAFVESVLEATTEWVIDENGLLVERAIENTKNKLKKLTLNEKLNIDDYLSNLFTDFLKQIN